MDDSRLIAADVGPGVVGFPSSSGSRPGFIARCELLSVGGASSGVSILFPRLLCYKKKYFRFLFLIKSNFMQQNNQIKSLKLRKETCIKHIFYLSIKCS